MVAYSRETHLRRIADLLAHPLLNAEVLNTFPDEEIAEARAMLEKFGIATEAVPRPWVYGEWRTPPPARKKRCRKTKSA